MTFEVHTNRLRRPCCCSADGECFARDGAGDCIILIDTSGFGHGCPFKKPVPHITDGREYEVVPIPKEWEVES